MSDEKPRVSRWKRNLFILTILCIPIGWFGWKVYTTKRYHSQARQLRRTIDALEPHCPADVSERQWKEAVQWTSNLVAQDFYSPDPTEFIGLQKLNQQLEQKKSEPIDLGKLRWIWDEIEAACGGPNSCASNFRNVKLMTKGPITDERLPSLWALERCTGLDLSETEITDASVPFLLSLPKLERLEIRKTKITETGALELQSGHSGLKDFHEATNTR